MKTNAEYLGSDDYEIQVTITMKSKEWQALADLLPEQWPAYEMRRQVKDVIQNLRRRVGIKDNMETSY